MIIKEEYMIRADGVKLFRTYSDEGKQIIQNETGIIYSEAIDVEDAPYTYSEGDEFVVDKYLLNQITPYSRNNTGKYDASKLRQIGAEVSNDLLVEAIRKGEYDEDILELLGKSVLLNVVSSSQECEDGILHRHDAFDFKFTTVKEGKSEYGVLFTGIDKIKESSYNQDNYYFQITNYFEVFKYVLMNDLDGVIINPGTDEFYIERHVLLRIYEDKRLENPDLANSIDYAFKI
jgi:hypothetical protein